MERLLLLTAFAFAALYLVRLIKPQAPQFALAASLCAGIIMVLFFLPDLIALTQNMKAWADQTRLSAEWLASLVKMTAVCLTGQWGSRFCRDAGEEALAEKLETASKVTVLLLCVPYLDQLFALAVKYV